MGRYRINSPGFIRLLLLVSYSSTYVEIEQGLKRTIQYSQEESKISLILAIKG